MTDMQFKETAVLISKNKTNERQNLLHLRQVPTSLLLGLPPSPALQSSSSLWVYVPDSMSLSIQWFGEGFGPSVVLRLSQLVLPQLLTQHDNEVQQEH